MNRFFYLSLILVFICATLGELIRLPIGSINGILPNDLILAFLSLIWLIHKTFLTRKLPKTNLWIPFLIFIILAFISLVNGSRFLSLNEFLNSGFYLFRFFAYFILSFIVFDLTKNPIYRSKIIQLLFFSATVIALFGFIQLKWFPDFTQMQDYGWDPHLNRLLSTWFDPNFTGGMFAFVLCLGISQLISKPYQKIKPPSLKKIPLIIIIITLLLALTLTYSRSAYLSFIVGTGLIGLLKSRKLLFGALIACLLLISFSDRAQERINNLYYSAKSIITQEATELPDATARLRVDSWQNTLIIIKDHPILGVGYNAFGFAQRRYGFVDQIETHSSTGSDSSLLTILATTGILGFSAYLWIIVIFFISSLKNKQNPLAMGFLAGTCGLLIHSIFVNSLLFSPFLIFFYTATGLILTPQKTPKQ